MLEQSNEQLFRRIVEEGFGRGNTAVIDDLFAPDFVEHQYGVDPPNAEGVKKSINELHRALPDFTITLDDVASAGDKVWGLATGTGTHQGQLGPVPATGRKIEIPVISIARFRDGKVVEHWGVMDRLQLLEQLGIQPPPGFVLKMLAWRGRR